jgi:thioredoxin-related protein
MKNLLIATLTVLSISATAQVQFKNITFKQALEQAGKEGKMVFIDVYTTWCGPCKLLDKEVFSDPLVGERLNKDFVCLKIDNEKSADKEEIAPYEIKGYPTMLVLNAKGEEVKRLYGYHDREEMFDKLDLLLPENEQPKNKAVAALKAKPSTAEEWRKHLSLLREKDYQLFAEYTQKYVDLFPLVALHDELDHAIFQSVTLPLENVLVKKILEEGFNGSSIYTYQKYLELALAKEYCLAESQQQKDEIINRAKGLHAKFMELTGNDFASEEYFLDTIKQLSSTFEKPEIKEEKKNTDTESIAEPDKKTKSNRKKKK